jgi:hypothetical protein
MSAIRRVRRQTSDEMRLRERLAYAAKKDAEEAERRAAIAKRWAGVDYSKHDVKFRPSGYQPGTKAQ